MIVVEGGVGTAIEAWVAYQEGKPIVAIQGSVGTADEIVGKYLDDRQAVKIMKEKDPRIAVRKVKRASTKMLTKEEKSMK